MQHLTEKEIREKFKEKFPHVIDSRLCIRGNYVSSVDSRDEVEDFWLSLRSQELQGLIDKVEKIPTGYFTHKKDLYDTGAEEMRKTVLAILQEKLEK